MSTIKDGGPAFPFPVPHGSDAPRGMTLRDFFAAKYLEGQIANPESQTFTRVDFPNIAAWSYAMADAMLVAREKQP